MKKRKYTLREFFDTFPVKQDGVAERAGISPNLFRQYVCGAKEIPLERLGKTEKAIKELGKDLAKIKMILK